MQRIAAKVSCRTVEAHPHVQPLEAILSTGKGGRKWQKEN
jgi:hypothetical protein